MIEFKPDINGLNIAYDSFENGKHTGNTTLIVDNNKCYLKTINAVDDLTAEGLIRSAINAAANRDAYVCIYEPVEFRDVAENLGFENRNDTLTGEIPFLLSGCCGCNK